MIKRLLLPASEIDADLSPKAQALFSEHQQSIYKHTDRLFIFLMIFQWLAGIAAALWISPKTWIGAESSVHMHVWTALLLGGVICFLPVFLAACFPGRKVTRYMIAVSQMLMSALLIHLTGGRIETHFHVFGSLAILAFYRDWKVLVPATLIVAADHFVRGIYFPQSVFGVLTVSPWRWVEHAGWVVFEDVFLITSCIRSVQEMKQIAGRTAQLENMNDAISQQVREQTSELRQTRDSALQATKAKSEFLATMSHEIRTPMNSIIGMSELLFETSLSEGQRQYLGVLKRNGENLLRLINDILDLSKMEAGKMEIEKIQFNLGELIFGVNDVMMSRAKEKNLKLLCELHPDIPSILIGDPNRIRQVLLNLVGNAVKFTEKGEVVVKVQRKNPRRAAAGEKEELLFTVRDTGIGIPADKIDALFQSFAQVDSSTTRKYGGTGLGLAISKKIVECMEGRIWIESAAASGTVFSFMIPLEIPMNIAYPENFSKSESPLPMPARSKEKQFRILLAEDHPDNQLLIKAYLGGQPYVLDIVENGKEAVERFKVQPYDMILMDLHMPQMDGYEATRLIREREKQYYGSKSYQRIPIIAISASVFKDEVDKSLEAGCDKHLMKPLMKKTLLDVISECSRKAELKGIS